MEETKIKGFKIIFTDNFLTIKDSYKLSNIDKIKSILTEALSKTVIYRTKRSLNSLIREWVAHAILYKMHFFRKHTTDTDLEKVIKKRVAFSYFIISFPSMLRYSFLKKYYKIKTKVKEKQYKKYIKNHRNNVKKAYKELINNPNIYLIADKEILDKLYKRVLVHDNSKYSLEEFDAYRKNFYPINKREKEENVESFKKAWEHHWKNNSHHWQFRQDKKFFNIYNDEEVVDVLENVVDWLAMGYQFKNRPYQYYEKNKNDIILCDKERNFLEHILYDII